MNYTLLDTAFFGFSTLVFFAGAGALVLFIIVLLKLNKVMDIWLKKNSEEPSKKS